MRQLTGPEIIVDTLLYYGENPAERRSVRPIAECINGEVDGGPAKPRCMYAAADGRRCAYGRCLTDEALAMIGESHTASYWHKRLQLKPEYRGQDGAFWDEVQKLHDQEGFWTLGCFTFDALVSAWAMIQQHRDHDPDNLTKAEIIIETAVYYGSKPSRRSLIPKEEADAKGVYRCQYNGPDGKCCAFSRCIEPDQRKALNEGEKAGQCLRFLMPSQFSQPYRKVAEEHTERFWNNIQGLHDDDINFTKTGLSPAGLSRVWALLNTWTDWTVR